MDLDEEKIDDDDILGLDEDEEEENFIFIEVEDKTIYKFPKEYLKDIELIQTIIKSDKQAGRSEDNTLMLSYVKKRHMIYLKEYIDYHKDKDYIVNLDPKIVYRNKVELWDRAFVRKLKKANLIDEFLKCTNYLLYEPLTSKICCYLANSEEPTDYRDLFIEIKKN